MTKVSESTKCNSTNNLLTTAWSYITKPFTHHYCDTCGFTKDEVFITEYFMESGFRQCRKCIDKSKLNRSTDSNCC